MVGVGKSVLGKALAKKIGARFIDTDKLIEKIAGVVGEDSAVGMAVVFEQDQFVAAFAESQEQGQQKGGDKKPAGEFDSDDNGAGQGTQDKTRGDAHNINNNNVFEEKRIRQTKTDIAGGNQKKSRAQKVRKAQTDDAE